MLKEVRLWIVVVGELDKVSELFLGGKGLHQAGQDGGIVVLHTLVEEKESAEEVSLASMLVCLEPGGEVSAATSVLLQSPLSTAPRMVCWTTSL